MIKKNREVPDEMSVTPAAKEIAVVLSVRVQNAIGQSLIAHYNDIINAPIPDKFLVLLAELEAKEEGSGK